MHGLANAVLVAFQGLLAVLGVAGAEKGTRAPVCGPDTGGGAGGFAAKARVFGVGTAKAALAFALAGGGNRGAGYLTGNPPPLPAMVRSHTNHGLQS